jgi:hypothetical protein
LDGVLLKIDFEKTYDRQNKMAFLAKLYVWRVLIENGVSGFKILWVVVASVGVKVNDDICH